MVKKNDWCFIPIQVLPFWPGSGSMKLTLRRSTTPDLVTSRPFSIDMPMTTVLRMERGVGNFTLYCIRHNSCLLCVQFLHIPGLVQLSFLKVHVLKKGDYYYYYYIHKQNIIHLYNYQEKRWFFFSPLQMGTEFADGDFVPLFCCRFNRRYKLEV